MTLTVRNCVIADLGNTLTVMNNAFKKLTKRKEFKPVFGWVRTTEVTRGSDGSAHPHFHTLMMVPSSWFTRDYVKHSRWVELWGDCLRVNYAPNVNIKTVKPKSVGEGKSETISESLQDAVAETLKYSVKPSDMISDPEWFLELTRQVFKRRFVATGGVLKDILKLTEESNEDLALADGIVDGEDDGSSIAFSWGSEERRYKRDKTHDK